MDPDEAVGSNAGEEPECRTDRVATLLRDPAFAGGREVTVLTHVDRGPEILYRTGHRVLAGPYHRNLRGIEDIHRAFTLPPDDSVVHRILRERDVGIVLLCPATDRGFLGRGEEGSTFHRLVDGPLPAWAVEREMPPEPSTGFRVFRVVAPNPASDAGQAATGAQKVGGAAAESR